MARYSLTHLSDGTLLHDLATLVAQDRTTTAAMLAHLAEVEARRLYAKAGYDSMYAYCVGNLGLSEDAACNRIRAARMALRFPVIFEAIFDGRLHLRAVVMLAPHLTEATATELLAAAAHKTKTEIEHMLARRFPQPDVPTLVQAIPPTIPTGEPAPVSLDLSVPGRIEVPVSEQVEVRHVDAPAPRPKVTPLAPQRFALQVTIDQSTHDKLRHAQALLGHQIPSGDVAQVLDRALDALIAQLEKHKFAATDKPRPSQPRSHNPRHIPAEVKRAVRKRDGEQCTFVSEKGRRCEARACLEFDHVDPVARGGLSTVGNVRLRCRTHNQFEADCAFGSGFMNHKRQEAEGAASARPATSYASGSAP